MEIIFEAYFLGSPIKLEIEILELAKSPLRASSDISVNRLTKYFVGRAVVVED